MQRIGSYNIVQQLSSDAFGVLYEAVDEQQQRRAQIKVLHQDLAEDRQSVRRFLNEVKAVNRIAHPGIVKIYEHGELPGGAAYIIMEFLQGETLRDRMRQLGGRMEPAKAMRIARQIASALAAAHAKEVVHRDLKPGNIMLIADQQTPEGEHVKLLNFAIAKLSPSPNSSPLTQPADAMGTPTYMSPEQCKSAREVTDRSDVYSIGVMLYELLAGAPPFSDSKGAVGMMMAHLQQDPPPLATRAPDASPQLCRLVNRMLAKTPTERPSADAVAALLAQLSGQDGVPLSPALALPEPPSEPSLTATMLDAPAAPVTAESRLRALGRARGNELILAGALAAVLLGLLGIVSAIREIRRSSALLPPIVWSVDSEPSGADVADGAGVVLGHTPWQNVQPPGRGLLTLTIRKVGYSEDQVVLDRAQNAALKITLPKLPAPLPAVQPSEPPPPPAKVGDGQNQDKRGKKQRRRKERSR